MAVSMTLPTIPVAGQPSAPVDPATIRKAVDDALASTAEHVQVLSGSTPNPLIVAIVAGELRNISAAAGGALSVYSQTVSGQEWQLIVGIIVAGAPLVFTWISKKWAAIRLHETAKASASASASASATAGAPVAIPVQPA